MKALDEYNFYWLFSKTGKVHLARHGDEKPGLQHSGEYVSLCKNLTRKDDGVEEPIPYEEHEPEQEDMCLTCREELDRLKKTTVVVSIPKKDAKDLLGFLRDNEMLEDERCKQIVKNIEDSINPLNKK